MLFNDLVYSKAEGIPADLAGEPINWEEERAKLKAEIEALVKKEEQG